MVIRILLEFVEKELMRRGRRKADDGRECSDYDDFFRRTSYEPPAGVIDRYGKMVRYDDGVVVRYLERVDVYPDRIVVRFKAGVEVRVERRK